MKYAIILGGFQRFDTGTKYTLFRQAIFLGLEDVIFTIDELMSVNYNSRLTTIKIPGIKN